MSWQIQCKQHFLRQLYTLNNQLKSEETLTWHEDVQMYCWDCMRVREGDYSEFWACIRVKRGATFCCWMYMRVVECIWDMRVAKCIWEFMTVIWQLREFCKSCWERNQSKESLNPEWLDQTKWWDLMGNKNDQPTWRVWPQLKIEFLRLDFHF